MDSARCNICKRWFIYAENSSITYYQWLTEFIAHVEAHLEKMGITL